MNSPSASLIRSDLFARAASVLKAIQDIPSLRHVPVLDRMNLGRDVALDTCFEKATLGLETHDRTRLFEEFFGLGPVTSIAGDPRVTEILISAPDCIWIERDGKLEMADDRFLDRVTYRCFLARLSRDARTNTDENAPFANGRWRDFRVHVVGHPIVSELSHVSLRRVRVRAWTLEEMAENGWADSTGVEALEKLVRERANVIVIGSTGSGKTSALSACLQKTEPHDRAVVLEDTEELILPNRVSIRMLSKVSRSDQDTEFGLGDLLKQSLRMRPDRIVMGEVRGAEAKDLLMAFATGHSGCWGTLHAGSPREALLRLEMLVQMGAPQWNTATVRALIHASIDAVVLVGKDPNGKRRLESVHQVASLEEIGFCFSPLYARTSTKLPRG